MNTKLESILAELTSINRSIETMAECDHAGRMIDLASLRARRESVMGELVAMIQALEKQVADLRDNLDLGAASLAWSRDDSKRQSEEIAALKAEVERLRNVLARVERVLTCFHPSWVPDDWEGAKNAARAARADAPAPKPAPSLPDQLRAMPLAVVYPDNGDNYIVDATPPKGRHVSLKQVVALANRAASAEARVGKLREALESDIEVMDGLTAFTEEEDKLLADQIKAARAILAETAPEVSEL